ncbi:Uncharacterised protein [Streptococcus pneumoniae]|nr:Uncharacterised protein [Streptococcus pneumoniae]
MPIASPPLPIPKKIRPNPAIIINRIVTILIIANQNSNSPNDFTEIKLAAPRITIAIIPGIQAGKSGNQYCIYAPTAIISDIPTITHWNQLLHAVI